MNRDILLGVSFSLVLHGLVLWVGAHIQRETTRPRPLPAILDLSIIRTSTYRENPGEKGSIQKVPRRVPSPMPAPLRSRPEFAKMKQTASRNVLAERVKRTEKTIKAGKGIRKTPFSEHITAPKPIWNARVILKEMNLGSEVSERQKIPMATPRKWLMPDTEASPSGISLPVDRISDNRKPPSTKDRENKLASIGEPLSEPTKPSNKRDSGPDIRHETYVPDRGGSQIIEAVPEYAINPKPVYPKLAIRRDYEGAVTLMVEVLPDGSVREVEIFESSGHAMLDRSALKAVRKWRFRPGTKRGKPVTMKVKVPVVFRLKRDIK